MNRQRTRDLANQYLTRGDPLGWFEPLYADARGDPGKIPWADCVANPNLVSWVAQSKIRGEGLTSLVVGCGLGDDAEYLTECGFSVTAFDISEKAIRWCGSRFPRSCVEYRTADLFNLPVEWCQRFDLVFESYTLQVLPPELRAGAIERIASTVRAGGTLLVISRGRDQDEPKGKLPWPLSVEELTGFEEAGLRCASFEDFRDDEDPPVRRFRVEYQRPK